MVNLSPAAPVILALVNIASTSSASPPIVYSLPPIVTLSPAFNSFITKVAVPSPLSVIVPARPAS